MTSHLCASRGVGVLHWLSAVDRVAGPDMEMPNALGEMGRADPLPSRLRGLESSFPSGVWGRAPAENSSGTFRTPKQPFVNRVLLNVLRTKRTGNDVQEIRGWIKYRDVSRRKITCPAQSEIVDRTLCGKTGRSGQMPNF